MNIPLPPPAYSAPYMGPLYVTVGTLAEVERLCHTQWGISISSVALGCSWWQWPTCMVVIPKVDDDRITFEIQGLVLKHELGHCNGWPATHPQK